MKKNLMGYKTINGRLLTARLHSELSNLFIVQICTPTFEKDYGVQEEFWDTLQATLSTAVRVSNGKLHCQHRKCS